MPATSQLKINSRNTAASAACDDMETVWRDLDSRGNGVMPEEAMQTEDLALNVERSCENIAAAPS